MCFINVILHKDELFAVLVCVTCWSDDMLQDKTGFLENAKEALASQHQKKMEHGRKFTPEVKKIVLSYNVQKHCQQVILTAIEKLNILCLCK